jgi:SAM-dependent methyltransferase
MFQCLACRATDRADLTGPCPRCGVVPASLAGLPAFAPDRAAHHDGFGEDVHDYLQDVEAESFWFRSRNRLIVALLRRYFPSMESFYEVGCGTGFVLGAIREAFGDVELWGSELGVDGLAIAKRRRPRARLFQADARDLPLVEHVDVAGAFDVLEHIDDDAAALGQIARSVRPGGGVILTVPQHPWLWSATDELSCHKRRYTRRRIRRLCRSAGLRPMEITSFVALLLPVMCAMRLVRSPSYGLPDSAAQRGLAQRLVDRGMELVCSAERIGAMAGIDYRAGGSLVCVARKS